MRAGARVAVYVSLCVSRHVPARSYDVEGKTETTIEVSKVPFAHNRCRNGTPRGVTATVTDTRACATQVRPRAATTRLLSRPRRGDEVDVDRIDFSKKVCARRVCVNWRCGC